MLTAELGEAVIGTDKEVVAADVVMIVIWWPVRRDGLGEFSPLELDGVLQLLPGKDGAVMNLGPIKLGGGTTILGKAYIHFLFELARFIIPNLIRQVC